MPREVCGSRLPGGLVAHQQRRTIHDGSGDRNALLFAAGKLVGALIELVLQANETPRPREPAS